MSDDIREYNDREENGDSLAMAYGSKRLKEAISNLIKIIKVLYSSRHIHSKTMLMKVSFAEVCLIQQ